MPEPPRVEGIADGLPRTRKWPQAAISVCSGPLDCSLLKTYLSGLGSENTARRALGSTAGQARGGRPCWLRGWGRPARAAATPTSECLHS